MSDLHASAGRPYANSRRLNPAEAADRLGISRDAVYQLCDPEAPQIGHFRIGRRIVIPEEAIVAFEAQYFVAPADNAKLLLQRALTALEDAERPTATPSPLASD